MPSRAQQSGICKDLTILTCHSNIPLCSEGQPWMLPPPPVRHHDLHPHNIQTASCFPTSAMLQREARSFSNTYPPSSKENQTKRSRRNNTNQVAAREIPFYREHKNFLKTDLIDKRDIQYTLYVEDLTAEYINTDYFLLYEF